MNTTLTAYVPCKLDVCGVQVTDDLLVKYSYVPGSVGSVDEGRKLEPDERPGYEVHVVKYYDHDITDTLTLSQLDAIERWLSEEACGA